ncbi:MAG: helix-turn-helix domain-containing protein [Thermoanaerobaculia bacterium]
MAQVELECVSEPERARVLLEALRLRILELAAEPCSATELAGRMSLPRQRVNYHVRELARAGFLRPAGRRRKRNMFEQRYVAASRGLLLSPELLGGVGANWRTVSDPASPAYMLALSAQLQSDVMRIWRQATEERKKITTLSIKSQFRFENPRQREAFTRALSEAVVSVISRYTSPNLTPAGAPAPGRPYRLVLGCYPYAPQTP